MLRRFVLHLPWMLFVTSVGFSVAAQQLSPDWLSCVKMEKALSPDGQITACTAVLTSDRETATNRAIAYSIRGAVYQVRGDNTRAIADYSQAISLDPGYSTAYARRGNAYIYKGDYNRAIADLNEA